MIHLPDGVTAADLETLDFEALAQSNPEQAAMLCDLALKYSVYHERLAWIQQCRIIHVVKKHQLWQHHPEGWGSFEQWIMQPEIGLFSGQASEMATIADTAEQLLGHDFDLWAWTLEVGIRKARATASFMRACLKEGTLEEQLIPVLEEARASALEEILEMVDPKGDRLVLDPDAVIQEHADGSFTLTLPRLSFDSLELIDKKLRFRRWFNQQMQPVRSPLALEA